jgi:hypothetical protein
MSKAGTINENNTRFDLERPVTLNTYREENIKLFQRRYSIK